MVVWLHVGALGGYLVSALALSRALAEGERTAPRSAAAIASLGVLVHLAASAAYTAEFGELPLVGLGPSLSTLALLIGALTVTLLWLVDLRPIGVILLPFVSLLLGSALLLGVEPTQGPMAFRGWWFALHVLLTLTGYACFAGAFATGLLYLLQHRELKGRRFGRMFRFFPPLATLGRWQRRALEVSLPALTLGVLVGWAWMVRFEPLPATDPKVIWAAVSWVAIATALVSQLGTARERRGAYASVVGFAVVVVCYVVLRLTESGAGRDFL